MKSKAFLGIIVTLLLMGISTLTFETSYKSVLAVEPDSIGPGALPDWHEDAQVQLGWIFDDPTNPQDTDPLPGWNTSIGYIPVWDYDPNRIVWDQPGQWYIRIPNLINDRPVKNFWICWVYDFDTYLNGTRSATNIDWYPDEGSDNPQYIEEWFDSEGMPTEDYLEAAYARVTFSLDLYPNPEYEDVWLGTYGEVALVREVYIMTLCTPTISIYTDKYSYGSGDTMYVGLDISNPGEELPCCLALWAEPPGSGARVFMHKHNIALPSGFDYSNSHFMTFVLPSIPAGVYTWHTALVDPSTHDIIVEDTAEWEFT